MARKKQRSQPVGWIVAATAALGVAVGVVLAVVLSAKGEPTAAAAAAAAAPADDSTATARAEQVKLLERLRELNDANAAREAELSAKREELVRQQQEYEVLTGQTAPL